MLIGNVGRDPEIRYIDSNTCSAQVSLATSTPGYTLPNGTVVPEKAEWHRLLFWRKLAEVVERYVKKGDKLIFTAFGAGFTWGASYMIWGYDGAAEAAKEPAQFYKEGLMTREEWNALRHHDDNV